MSYKKILITSALLYANGPLHFGHLAGAYLPADCYARYKRMQGDDVIYISGSDEYGIAITLSAELANRSCKEHVDHFHQVNKDLFDKLQFTFDHYGRTTEKIHDQDTIDFFNDLLENGYIEKKEEKHLFSEEENRFLSDRYVVGTCPKCGFEKARGDECLKCSASFDAIELKNPRSKLKNTPLSLKPSTHWYLRFDMFREKLLSWIEEKGWKDNVVAFAKNYIEDLKPRSITRDSKWGIEVPLKEANGKVFYVWFDAPIGYISITKELAKIKNDPKLWEKYWLDSETKLVHFIGKDNIPFHTVFFPAMCMGQNTPYKLVDQVPANEFLMLEGKQFSKSDGWYIDLKEFLESYSSDQIRYYLAANAPESQDSDFSWKAFQQKCNGDLLGKLGNLVHRTFVFTHNFFDGKVPQLSNLTEEDKNFQRRYKELLEQIQACYEMFSLRKASMHIMELCQLANTYFDHKMPWKFVKSTETIDQAKIAIHLLLDCIKNIAVISSPIIPETSQKIWNFFGYESKLQDEKFEKVLAMSLEEEKSLLKPEVLFTKIEDETIENEIAKLGAKEDKEYEPLKENISFDDFMNVDLRVGQILSCEKVPKSKKLFKLEVDIGIEKRTIVSGIAQYFTPEDLIGKKVPIVANIPPAKLMGIESQGMVLAASFEKELKLPEIQDLPAGSIIS